jgi:hypothetical protein
MLLDPSSMESAVCPTLYVTIKNITEIYSLKIVTEIID